MKLSMNIGTRVLAGHALALLVVGAVGVVAYRGITELVDSNDWVTHTHKVKEGLSSVLSRLVDADTAQRNYLIAGEERYLNPYRTAVNDADGYVRQVQDLTADNPRQQARIVTLLSFMGSKRSLLESGITLRKENAHGAALTAWIDRGNANMADIRRVAVAMDSEEDELLKGRIQTSKGSAQFARYSIIWGGAAVTVLVCVVAFLTHRSIAVPLRAYMEFADAIGKGDLTRHAPVSGEDDLGKLAETLNRMAAGLRGVASQTQVASGNLNSAVAEIVASTRQQSAGTAEQAAAIQQTTSTMDELTQAGAQISDRAKQLAASSEAVSSSGRAGLEAVQNTVVTMEAIREQAEALAANVVGLSEKTQAVGEIVATVNDIAEQSHLLALNAAIEAAAAGDHGRSFAVVATEMKTLADQCREATVQVRSILGDIQKGITSSVMLTEEAVKRVEAGKEHTGVADGTIRQMNENIQRSISAFQQIAAGANQQQIGFEQIVQAIRNINQAATQTAAGTQQMEKAAVSVGALSRQMQKTVEGYKV